MKTDAPSFLLLNIWVSVSVFWNLNMDTFQSYLQATSLWTAGSAHRCLVMLKKKKNKKTKKPQKTKKLLQASEGGVEPSCSWRGWRAGSPSKSYDPLEKVDDKSPRTDRLHFWVHTGIWLDSLPDFAKHLSHHGWQLARYAEAAVWVWMEEAGKDRLVSSCTSVTQSAIIIWWLSYCWHGATHLLTEMRKLNCTLREPLPAASSLSLGKQKLKKLYPLIVGSSCRFRWPKNHACMWPKLSLPRVAGPSVCQHELERK